LREFVKNRVWEAYENLTWAQPCQTICRLDWHSPQLQKGERAKCSTAALHKNKDVYTMTRLCRKQRSQAPLFLVTTRSRSPENCCLADFTIPLPCLTLYINKFSGSGRCCCVSPPEHLAHLIPAFCMFVFCPLSISHHSQLGF
jgi:hypothetical protein